MPQKVRTESLHTLSAVMMCGKKYIGEHYIGEHTTSLKVMQRIGMEKNKQYY